MKKIDVMIDEHLANHALLDMAIPEAKDVAATIATSGSGIVYLLTNPSMLGLVKIRMTTRDIDSRLRDLNAPTGVPQPFEVFIP